MDLPEALTTTTEEKEETGTAAAQGGDGAEPAKDDDKKHDDDDVDDDDNSLSFRSDDDDDDDDLMPDAANDDDDDDRGVSPEQAERLLLEACNLKEQGNAAFAATTASARDDAVRCYRRGLHRLKKLRRRGHATTNDDSNKNVDVVDCDPQVTALWVALSTNLATVLFQLRKYAAAASAATQALEAKPTHCKALYRRAQCRRLTGDCHAAVTDLQTALTVEPNNAACRKELRGLQQAMRTARQRQRAALSKAFSAGVSLYDDKKDAPARPTPQELAAALEEQKKRWEDECVKRMSAGQEAVSFEDWQTEQKEKAEREEKKEREREAAAKKKEQEERQQAAAARKAARAAAKASKSDDDNSSTDDDDDEKLTESELQALRGYKKTKDGRVTSYFTRELSEEEKAKLAAVPQGPQKIETTTSTATSTSANAATAPPLASSSSSSKGPSAWNRAGTWEEKDTTEWCSNHLRTCLLQVRTASCHVIKVDSLTGDASIVHAGGRLRHVFDFHVTLHYAWTGEQLEGESEDKDTNAEASKPKRAKGVVKLPEISSTSTQEGVEVVFEKGWKRAPTTAVAHQHAEADRPALEQALQDAVQAWLRDFHEEYRA